MPIRMDASSPLAPAAHLPCSVLALETLKRALAPANRWRDSLVASCLAAGLVTLLLQRLDWRHAAARRQQEQGQQEVRWGRVLVGQLAEFCGCFPVPAILFCTDT